MLLQRKDKLLDTGARLGTLIEPRHLRPQVCQTPTPINAERIPHHLSRHVTYPYADLRTGSASKHAAILIRHRVAC